MFQEIIPIVPNTDPYATVDTLLVIDDLIEQDVTIRRWYASGKSLKVRLKALNLEQELDIQQAALTKNAKTGNWEQHRAIFCAESLVRLIRVPALDIDQARALVKKNPVVIGALVDFGWALSSLDSATLEAAALALTPPPADDGAASGAD
jgi:hypothetical protein